MIRATKDLLRLQAGRLNEISNVKPQYRLKYDSGYIYLISGKTGRYIYTAKTKSEMLKVMWGLEQLLYTENGL